MKIENSFTLDAPITRVWPMLTNIAMVASCVPGVSLTKVVDGVHSGSVKSKVGPVTAEYQSSATLLECDEAERRVVLEANGHDWRGAGNVHMLVTAHMVGTGAQTRIDLRTRISGTGKVAQLGRGVLQAASEKLLDQFIECMGAKLNDAELAASTMASTPPGFQGPVGDEPDHEALDLLGAAGAELAKRALPIAIALVVLVIVLLIVL